MDSGGGSVNYKWGDGWLLEGTFEIAVDAQGLQALEPCFMKKDSPPLHSTVSSHSLEQEPWAVGLSLKVLPVPSVHSEAGTRPHSVPCEGNGPCLQQLLVWLGVTMNFAGTPINKGQLCVWVDSQETAALAVCSFPPVPPASSLREASRDSRPRPRED